MKIRTPAQNPKSNVQKGLYLRKQDLRKGIELLFFAYRDFTAEADRILEPFGLGRAHHRVLYFVGRHPNMRVRDLLDTLNITKQSLSRVLSHLIQNGYVQQKTGERDKRQRLLRLTDKGKKLEAQLTEAQSRRFAAAYSERGGEDVTGFQNLLISLLNPETRHSLRHLYPDSVD